MRKVGKEWEETDAQEYHNVTRCIGAIAHVQTQHAACLLKEGTTHVLYNSSHAMSWFKALCEGFGLDNILNKDATNYIVQK